MTHRFGEIKSNLNIESIADQGFDEISAISTVSTTLEDITGLTFNLIVPPGLPSTAVIRAILVVQCSTTGGSPATGGWAISIDGSDGTEIQRYLSGLNDTGVLAVMHRAIGFSEGSYTVKGRHRRVSGSSTVNSDIAQLKAEVVLE